MSECLIRAENMSKIYRLPAESIHAVDRVNIEIKREDFVSLMGPSGSGKTTLLDCLGCLDKISSGKLEMFGKDVSDISENKLVQVRRQNIGFIFQDFLLIPSLTVLENVELPLLFARKKKNRTLSEGLLRKVGLGHRIKHLPKEISGGERQRVAVARALVTSPKILIADEPTGNLDTKTSQDIFNLFKELNEKDGVTIVIATHNQKLGSQTKTQVYLRDGRIVTI